ncbi:ABC transporter ATP-binding protein [Desulfospira joergensenii]|uniref:ABC transporter ATP-binding protein n=1 Tax=Desulfospira joergensenii TaxID=53329 RepID=UPI0003B4A353|nr:oligopeptide/dipeptide ABC transporter ATP-binding protein [Desulfospira joergensenii]
MTAQNLNPAFLELENIAKIFRKDLDFAARLVRRLGSGNPEPSVHAVDKVSLQINKGEVVGLVGESGCGKSTLGRIVAGLIRPTRGQVRFKGRLLEMAKNNGPRKKGLNMQMIFQDPFASLNPRMRVGKIIGEAPCYHGLVPREEIPDYVNGLMARCGLEPSYKNRFPHQFSGGQRQRIAICRALAVKPEFLVCDEVVSALDASIQAQIINLFNELRLELALTSLFISHDLGIVEHISDRVVIMYLGRIMEIADTETLFKEPCHPYTRALMSQVPRIEKRHTDFQPVPGEIPSPLSPPPGCHFNPRCSRSQPECSRERPELRQMGKGRWVACHLYP